MQINPRFLTYRLSGNMGKEFTYWLVSEYLTID
jgi:hypothetical protein